MFDFSKLSKFRLAAGSHDQPNPNGNICVTEAGVIAAGFAYKKIKSASDAPPCFSRAITAYAIVLNDKMPDDLRNKLLMPFVLRLSGTADTPAIERQRSEFFALENCRRIMSMMCRDVLKDETLALACQNVKTLKEAEDVCRNRVSPKARAAAAAYAADAAYAAADAAAYAADAAYAAAAAAAAYAAYAAAAAAAYAAADAAAREKYFTVACDILNEAILLGNHSTIDQQEAIKRVVEKCPAVCVAT